MTRNTYTNNDMRVTYSTTSNMFYFLFHSAFLQIK